MDETFAMRVKQYRKEHFMTQKQLAELIGLSVNYIGTLESGKRKPRASTIAVFEEAVSRWEVREKRLEIMFDRDGTDRVNFLKLVERLRLLDPEEANDMLALFHHILDWAEN